MGPRNSKYKHITPHLTVVPGILLQATLEAEEEDGPGGDVEEEGEADTEGGEEH